MNGLGSAYTDYFDPDRRAMARQYSRAILAERFLTLALGVFYLGALSVGGAGRQIWGLIASQVNPYLQVGVFTAIMLLGWQVLAGLTSLVTTYRTGYHLGLLNQSWPGWLQDRFLEFILEAIIGCLAGAGFLLLVTARPWDWWLWAWIGLSLFSLIMVHLGPSLIMPLFNRVEPLTESELLLRLEQLVRAAGLSIQGVYIMDMSRRTSGANAMLAGWGRTRRVILGDNLVSHFSAAEIEIVLAHELGHERYGHIWKSFLVETLGTGVMVILAWRLLPMLLPVAGASYLYEPIILPWLALLFALAGFFWQPIANIFSRLFERQSDNFALQLTGDPELFCQVMAKLGDQNLALIDPPAWLEYWFYSHPSIIRRIRWAKLQPRQT